MSFRTARGLVSFSAFLTLFTTGCMAHEPVSRPPSAEAIARINAFALEHGPLQVEYAKPIEMCYAGPCGHAAAMLAAEGNLVVESVRIESFDEHEIKLVTTGGETRAIPVALVAGVTATDRARGAAVGAVAGAVTGLVETAVLYALRNADFSGDQPRQSSCDGCVAAGLVLTVGGALVMAGLGYLIGGT